MTIHNATPHDVVIIRDGRDPLVIKPDVAPIRLAEHRHELRTTDDGIQINALARELAGMPPRELGVYYIVSSVVAQAAPSRDDLLVVDQTVRDAENRIIGCRGLARVEV